MKDNEIVHGLWIGKVLSKLELLTIHSFVKNGHTFHLWTYNEIEQELPEGALMKDANLIIPEQFVFSYKNANQFGHGKGSFAGFSDIFRYKLLYDCGGWWTDMDVCCLKKLDFPEPYVFRNHKNLPLVGNIMKCPKGSDLMKHCYEESLDKVNEDNQDWHKPIQILCDQVLARGLGKYVKELAPVDSWNIIRKFLYKKVELNPDWYIIHWINVEWTRYALSKDHFLMNSQIAEFCERFHVEAELLSGEEEKQTRKKLHFFRAALKQMPYLMKR